MEGPADLLLAAGLRLGDEDFVVDERGEGQLALVRGDGAGDLGVPQAEPQVDGRDRADRVEGDVADGQAAGAPAAAELGPVVLDAAVLDGEADLVLAGLLVDHAAQQAVAEERALGPGPGHPAPEQVLALHELGPGHTLPELPAQGRPSGLSGLGFRESRGGGDEGEA
ncbi:hypothetical protein [Nonomuraea sp. NPDC049625]|uniref:hypothetical protein n=1 Tax=Nonomuraea sp. NPDC049625 TaxID=3155775 RepID=UPI003441FFF1